MSFHPTTGRKVVVVKHPRTARELLRRHLREEGQSIVRGLAVWWNVKPSTAYRLMYDVNKVVTPHYIEAAIKGLRLDEFDANELRIAAAIDAGWKLNPNLQVA